MEAMTTALYIATQLDTTLFIKKEKLEPPAPCFSPRTKASGHRASGQGQILTYSRENPSAKMPKGNFEMPMSLHDISKFEDLNEV